MQSDFPASNFDIKGHALENLLNHIPFGFSLMTGDYVIESVNDFWLLIVQKARKEVLGKNLFDVFPETKEQLLPIFENIKKTGEQFYAPEYSIKMIRNGVLQDVFFNFVYHPIYNEDGKFQYFATVVIEITDLIGIKHKINEEEERLRLATESSQTGTWDLNLKTYEIVHSPYLAEIFGYEKDAKILHATLREHLLEEDRKNVVEKAFEKALKTGIYQYEARVFDINGVEKWIATNGKVFFDEAGNPHRMLGVMRDITDRKTNEILLRQSHHQLNTAMDATKLGRFDMNPETLEKI